jgi:hypothetical protein
LVAEVYFEPRDVTSPQLGIFGKLENTDGLTGVAFTESPHLTTSTASLPLDQDTLALSDRDFTTSLTLRGVGLEPGNLYGSYPGKVDSDTSNL